MHSKNVVGMNKCAKNRHKGQKNVTGMKNKIQKIQNDSKNKHAKKLLQE